MVRINTTADNAIYRTALLASHVAISALAVHVFALSHRHAYELHVQRSWYYFSTAGTCCLLASDLWRVLARSDPSALPPALSFGWCVLWIVHLGVEALVEHGPRYPSDLMVLMLGLQVARAGLLLPLVLARQSAWKPGRRSCGMRTPNPKEYDLTAPRPSHARRVDERGDVTASPSGTPVHVPLRLPHPVLKSMSTSHPPVHFS